MLKRCISVILCLAAVVCLFPSAVLAAREKKLLTNIDIQGFILPADDMALYEMNDFWTSEGSVLVDVAWYHYIDDRQVDVMYDDEPFTKGDKYYFEAKVKADTLYQVNATTTVTVDGSSKMVENKGYNPTTGVITMYSVDFEVTDKNYIRTVEFDCDFDEIVLNPYYTEGEVNTKVNKFVDIHDYSVSTPYRITGTKSLVYYDAPRYAYTGVGTSTSAVTTSKSYYIAMEPNPKSGYEFPEEENAVLVLCNGEYIPGTETYRNVYGRLAVHIPLTFSSGPVVKSVTVSPYTASVAKGDSFTFKADVVTGGTIANTVAWKVEGAKSTSTKITSGGILTVGKNETAASLTVTATSTADPRRKSSVNVKVLAEKPYISKVEVYPYNSETLVYPGETVTFKANVEGTEANKAVTWSISGAKSKDTKITNEYGGTTNDFCTVSFAPDETASSVTVTAGSAADTTVSGSFTMPVKMLTTIREAHFVYDLDTVYIDASRTELDVDAAFDKSIAVKSGQTGYYVDPYNNSLCRPFAGGGYISVDNTPGICNPSLTYVGSFLVRATRGQKFANDGSLKVYVNGVDCSSLAHSIEAEKFWVDAPVFKKTAFSASPALTCVLGKTVTLTAGGGTSYKFLCDSAGTKTTIQNFSSKTSCSWTPSKTGTYTLICEIKDSTGKSCQRELTYKVTSSSTPTYEVTYDANGGTGAPAKQTKEKDRELTLSSVVPTRNGYTFTGWNTDKDGKGTAYAAGAKYTANASATLYAQWKTNAAPTPVLKRLKGSGRQATAAAISKETFTSAENVFIASGENYADALAGVPLANAMNAPILLVCKSTGLDADTKAEIMRLGAKNAYILGGTGAIPETIENAIKALGCTTTRVKGADRFATAVEVANKLKEIKGAPKEVFFVYSHNYPDALAVSGVAAAKGEPILYVAGDGKLNAGESFLSANKSGIEKAYIIGGYGAIKEAADTNIGKYVSYQRIYGKDRYLTCAKINDSFKDTLTGSAVCIATGKNFPDALAGGVLAAKAKSPMILVSDSLLDYQAAYITSRKPSTVYVFGGIGAVSDATANAALNAAK